MDEAQTDLLSRKWLRLLAKSLTWGIGFGVGAGIVISVIVMYSNRSKVWNHKALAARHVKGGALYQLNDDKYISIKSVGVSITADLENQTSTDITLPISDKVMQESKDSGSLQDSPLEVHQQYFLPAHHIVRVELENADLCTAETKEDICYSRYLSDQRRLVIFDDSSRYEIFIDVPPFSSPKSTN